MSELCKGRVCIVTGAGRGVGREYALSLARHGAKVVVNDLGVSLDGSDHKASPADEVVALIAASGGEAVVSHDDVADFAGARRLIDTALSSFGQLDVLINNAGILRDRMLVNMSEPEWDAVIRVHLKGLYSTSHWAARHWREQSKSGATVDGRLINTTSISGLFGNPGQGNYAAAKAGIAAFTITVAQELARYGVTVNAVAPNALTRMTEDLEFVRNLDADTRGAMAPHWPAQLVTWLSSGESRDVTGQIFFSDGHQISVCEGWHFGPSVPPSEDPSGLGPLVQAALQRAKPAGRFEDAFTADH